MKQTSMGRDLDSGPSQVITPRKQSSRLSSEKRRYLFLQGVASPFFTCLADSLVEQGHAVFRVNFCGGDALYWGPRPAWNFRGHTDALPDFLATLSHNSEFTDLILFGNCRPVHRPAIRLAQHHGIRVHVFEEGYIRPNWITLERGGVNGESALPQDPAWYLRANENLAEYEAGLTIRGRLVIRAIEDMAYHAANIINPLLYPRYQTHRPHRAISEYAGWVRRFSRMALQKRGPAEFMQRLTDRSLSENYFLLPLQLSADAQVIHYSPYADMSTALDEIIRSFALHAPEDTLLVVKNHPLDAGLTPYRMLIERLQIELGLQGRIVYLESGDLETLLNTARGVVTINSTVGMMALNCNRPTKCLGQSIYNLAGLTCQSHLDDFWVNPQQPDALLYHAFRNVVIHTTQVNGSFYTKEGIRMTVAGSPRLLADPSPLEALRHC